MEALPNLDACSPVQVYFELTGSGGSSGVLHPVGTPRSFGAGRLDVFDYPHLPFLGELQAGMGTGQARAGGAGQACRRGMVNTSFVPLFLAAAFACPGWPAELGLCCFPAWLFPWPRLHAWEQTAQASSPLGTWPCWSSHTCPPAASGSLGESSRQSTDVSALSKAPLAVEQAHLFKACCSAPCMPRPGHRPLICPLYPRSVVQLLQLDRQALPLQSLAATGQRAAGREGSARRQHSRLAAGGTEQHQHWLLAAKPHVCWQ